MIKQDEKGNYYVDLRETQARTNEKYAVISEIVSGFFKMTDIIIQNGKIMEEITRKDLEKYYNEVEKKSGELKDDAKMLEFLMLEKGKINSNIIRADIRKDFGDKRYFESLNNKIIDPFIEQYKNWLLLKKTIPELNSINSPEISLKEKNENNQDKSEVSDLDSKQETPDSLISTEETVIELPKEFQQIECKAKKEEIESYFMLLVNKKNEINDMPYMTEDDLIKLLHKNFKIFKTNPVNKYFPLNLTNNQKGRLRYFLYKFYHRYSSSIKDKDRYAYFLIHNFDIFKNDSFKNMKKIMGETRKPIEKHIIQA